MRQLYLHLQKKKKRIDLLFPLIQEVYANNRKRVTTSVLNDVLIDAQAMNPTTTFNGGRLKNLLCESGKCLSTNICLIYE